MDKHQIRKCMGKRIRITAGIEELTGTLTNAEPSTMNIGAWGVDGGIEIPAGDWILTIDGRTREWSGTAELTLLDE